MRRPVHSVLLWNALPMLMPSARFSLIHLPPLRDWLTCARERTVCALVALLLLFAAGPAAAFGFEAVAARARDLAQAPYRAPTSTLPAELAALSYDEYRDIRFRPDRALWRGENLPFEVMFFHLGKFQTAPVVINEIRSDGAVRPLGFDRGDFDYGKNRLSPQDWGDVGYAGFRVHYPINTDRYKDEVVVFLGASYFRAIGAGQRYGLSARGLAIDTVGGRGEEFPRFTEFWIERPAPDAKSLVIHALLESPSATGAYRFEVRPGEETVTDVRMRLYLRREVATLGIAALTSMYMFGENQPVVSRGAHGVDFRPEVHDSDGLMVATGEGEWLWRPLINPSSTLTTSFATQSVRGFGLMQRDRSFASYEDVEARYELRPSLWIAPQGDWGPGRVELMQLHTPDETHDNIVAYWVPDALPPSGKPIDLAYRMHWQGDRQQRPPGAWVTQTRSGRGFAALAADEHQFIVDFAGPAIDALAADAVVRPVVTAGANGQIVEHNAYRNEAAGGWRLAIRVRQLDPAQPVELRGFLQSGTYTLSETWTNIIPPR